MSLNGDVKATLCRAALTDSKRCKFRHNSFSEMLLRLNFDCN